MFRRGFSLVEALLAVAIFAVILVFLVVAYINARESTFLSGQRVRATVLAKEGVSAVRNLRDEDFASVPDGTYGLSLFGGVWTLSGTSDITDIYTRSVTITTVDAWRRDIVSTVTWPQNLQRTGTVSLLSRLTDWRRAVSTIGDWSSPQEESTVDIPGNQDGWKIFAEGDYVYVVRNSGNPDFLIIDVSDTGNPSITGSLNLSGNPRDVFVSGNYAYVASNSNNQELQVVNVSNPVLPSFVGSVNLSGNNDLFSVYVEGATLFAARDGSGNDEFLTFDLSTPASPSFLDSVDTSSDANHLVVFGGYAYVASSHNGAELIVYDITNPSSISLADFDNISGNTDAFSVAGNASVNLVAVGRQDGFIFLYDVSTPTSVSQIGSFDANNFVRDLSFSDDGTLLFVASDENSAEFQVVDVSTPASPSLFGSVNLLGDLNGVFYLGSVDRVFAVGEDNSEEFVIFEPQ